MAFLAVHAPLPAYRPVRLAGRGRPPWLDRVRMLRALPRHGGNPPPLQRTRRGGTPASPAEPRHLPSRPARPSRGRLAQASPGRVQGRPPSPQVADRTASNAIRQAVRRRSIHPPPGKPPATPGRLPAEPGPADFPPGRPARLSWHSLQRPARFFPPPEAIKPCLTSIVSVVRALADSDVEVLAAPCVTDIAIGRSCRSAP
jgi:hypothetical protein